MRTCKYCGSEITKEPELMGIWIGPDAHIFCYVGSHPRRLHEPFCDDEIVTNVLTKYGHD